MVKITRREFTRALGGVGAAALVSSLPFGAPAIARGRARVVIVGGGAGGASAACAIKREAPDLSVTVIEPHEIYTTCFNSNHYFGGFRTLASLQHSYDGLRKLGIDVIADYASDIDTIKRTVRLERGSLVSYDRLVIAPGIDFKFEAIEGYSARVAAETLPHAWKAGPQTLLLKKQLEAMEDGGTVVMTVPGNPYRCPPGPYERACMIAHFLKTKKPKSKLVIFDAKKTFSKQPAFEEAFAKYYEGIIDLNLTNEIDDFTVVRVDPGSREVYTKAGITLKGAVVNVIPPQKAGDIAVKAGCVEGDWCPIKPDTFASAKVPNVYVVGDSAVAAEMPKSAYSANSQAKGAVADILAELAGAERSPARYRNTCWSLLAAEDSIKIGADYVPGEKDGKPVLAPSGPFVSQRGETDDVRRRNYAESLAWYHSIIADAFNDTTSLVHKG
jgi:NADPH-dependent 2,4-dienoyl-CoA reductase/sulfur reductase-like enzyme